MITKNMHLRAAIALGLAAIAALTLPTRADADAQTVREYGGLTSMAAPSDIAMGPDGALWFVEEVAGKIGRITTTGVVTEYTVPTDTNFATSIATGPDGALWFTEYSRKQDWAHHSHRNHH